MEEEVGHALQHVVCVWVHMLVQRSCIFWFRCDLRCDEKLKLYLYLVLTSLGFYKGHTHTADRHCKTSLARVTQSMRRLADVKHV